MNIFVDLLLEIKRKDTLDSQLPDIRDSSAKIAEQYSTKKELKHTIRSLHFHFFVQDFFFFGDLR